MNTVTKSMLATTLALTSLLMLADENAATKQPETSDKDIGCDACTATLFLPRPQGLNSAAIFDPFYWDCYDVNDRCWSLNVQYRFDQTINPERIATCLFGSPVLKFNGSKVTEIGLEPDKRAIIADNFGIRPDYKGEIAFFPRVQNHMIDMWARFELGNVAHECLNCWYFTIGGTFAHSSWDLRECERVDVPEFCDPETQDCCKIIKKKNLFSNFPPGYMEKTPKQNGLPTRAAPDIKTGLTGTYLFGDMQEPWEFGKFVFRDAQTANALANVDLILGYDLARCEDYHFGVFAKAVAPSGTRPGAKTVFEPIIGNGHHWELGGGVDAHWVVWQCDDSCITAYLNGNATTLFKNRQRRSFDLVRPPKQNGNGENGISRNCLSRYMLLSEFNEENEYVGRLINAIKFSTREVDSEFSVQGDAAFRFVYYNCGWAVGAGYNVYGRSREKLSLTDTSCETPDRLFAIKGISGVNSYDNAGKPFTYECACGLEPDDKRQCAYSASETGQGELNPENEGADIRQAGKKFTDNPFKPAGKGWDKKDAKASKVNGGPGVEYINTNDKPIENILDIERARIPRQITHKVFGHIDYQWENCYCEPYFGVGGEIEWAQSGDDCRFCTPGKWGAWVRGGIAY